NVARERKFRDVEFLVTERAKKNLFGIERQVRDRAALDLHPAVLDGARAVVIAAGNRYRHLDHSGLLIGIAAGWDGRTEARQTVLASVLAVKRRLRSSSLPGLTRQSIHLRKNVLRRRWMRGSSPRMTGVERSSCWTLHRGIVSGKRSPRAKPPAKEKSDAVHRDRRRHAAPCAPVLHHAG